MSRVIKIKEDEILDQTLRPKTWQDFLGQEKIKKNIRIIIEAAKERKETPDHMLFYGGSGLGKCINKESIIFTERGMITIGSLGNLIKKGFQENKVRVYSNPRPNFSSHFYNNGESKTIKIQTHQKYELEGTINHSIVSLVNGKMTFKQLKDIRKGDYVAIQRGQNFFGNITKLPEFNFIPKEHNHKNYNCYTIPAHISPGLARMCGYLIGDGQINKQSNGSGKMIFSNSNPQLLKDFQKLWLGIFNQKVKIEQWKNKCPVIRAGNVKIREFFLNIGLSYSTAKDKNIPFTILQAPKIAVKEFLRAYFECDGHIRPNCRQMEADSISNLLLKQIQIVLLNFGVISRVYKSNQGGTKRCPNPTWRLSITGGDVEIFLSEIGFISSKKNRAWKNFTLVQNTNKDIVPFGKEKIKEIKKLSIGLNRNLRKKEYRSSARGDISITEIKNCQNKILKIWEEIREKVDELSKISNPHIFWDAIEKIEKGWSHTVDLTVPSNHTFFANGFINHNTTLSHLIAKEMGANIRVTSGPVIEKVGDLAALLTNLNEGDVLFIDELHRLNKLCEEIAYPALEDFKLNIIIGKGPMAKTMELKLPHFTLIGATTRIALLSSPLRNRFGATFQLNFYKTEDIEKIIQNSAKILGVKITSEAIKIMAECSRFTPRIANRLLKRIRDFAQVDGKGIIDKPITKRALMLLEIDELGLELGDRKILKAIVKKFKGGPVGLKTLAAASSEEEDTILEVYEPYLMRLGLIERTPQGRVATKAAYEHLKLNYKTTKNLF